MHAFDVAMLAGPLSYLVRFATCDCLVVGANYDSVARSKAF